MNPLDVPEVEARLTQMLTHYDEATRSGIPAALDLDSAPPELRTRFEELRGCVDLLEGAWLRRERLHAEGADPEFLAMLEAPVQIGRFHIVRLLGRGGSGSVYLARDPKLRRDVALKVPSRETVLNRKTLERVWREAQVAAKLNHANLVPILDVVEIDKVPCLVSVYVRGVSLATWLARNGPAEPHDAAQLVAALADGVASMGDCGVVHRDLKPANILLQEELTQRREGAKEEEAPSSFAPSRLCVSFSTPKIVDFGLALDEYRTTQLTQDGAVLGTVPYMSPEQVDGKRGAVGHRSDVHALGAVFYEMLTGRPPFTGNSAADILRQIGQVEPVPPSALRPGIPADLDTICLACLEKSPARRYTARELAAELRRFLAGEPILRRPPGRVERVVRWIRKNGRSLAAAVLFLAVGMGAAFAVHRTMQPAPPPARPAREVAQEKRGLAHQYFDKGEIHEGRFELIDALKQVAGKEPDLENLIRLELAVCEQAVIRHHADLKLARPLTALTFSEDSKLLLTVMKGGLVQVWDVAAAKPLWEPRKHEEDVLKAVFSADGQTIQTACLDGKIRAWDVKTGELGRPETTVTGSLERLSAIGERKEALDRLLWKLLADRAPPEELRDHGTILRMDLSPDRKTAYTVSEKSILQAWDVAEGQPIGARVRHDRVIAAHAWHPEGTRMTVADDAGFVSIWLTKNGEQRTTPTFPDRVRSVAWANRSTLVTGHAQSVRFWDSSLARFKHKLPIDEVARFVATSPGTYWLAAANGETSVRVWQGAPRWPTLQPPVREGSFRALGVNNESVQGGSVHNIAVHPSNQLFVTSGLDDAVHFWDLKTHASVSDPVRHMHVALSANFSSDGRLLVTGGNDRIARVWHASTRQQLFTTAPLEGHVYSVSFSQDDKAFVTTTKEGPAQLWDAHSGRFLRQFDSVPKAFVAAFDPGSNALLLGGSGDSISLYDSRNGVERKIPHPGIVHSAVFSPSGDRFFTGDEEGNVRWWDRVTGDCYSAIRGHARFVWTGRFSADGKLVVTGSNDHTLRFWHPGNGVPLGPPLEFPSMVRSVAFHPDGKTLMVGCFDHKVHFVPLPQPVEGSPEEIALTARRQMTGLAEKNSPSRANPPH